MTPTTPANPPPAPVATDKKSGGLEGVVAASSEICYIDGTAGRLVFRGYEIGDLVEHTSFEEVAYLLWHGRLPNREELHQLKSSLVAEMKLPPHAMAMLEAVPADAVPMDVLRTVTSSLAFTDPDLTSNTPEANLRKAIRLTAQMPLIVTTFHRKRKKLPLVSEADPGLSLAGNFLYFLNGTRPNSTLERVMDAALILHAEHGMNASTFAARVTAATLADMHAAVTAAIAALKGPLHGGANQDVMELLLECGTKENVVATVQRKLANKEKIPGFGHRVYKTFDPRATFLRKMSRQLGEAAGDTKWYEMSETLIPIMKQQKNLDPNVDFFSASAYYVMGIPLDLFTGIFAIARITGWTAHIMEQHRNNRIIRPTDDYVGPFGRTVVPIDQR
ncbi:MAG: citrate/2-methylcitrate synthase [Tepidisphaerales bacterium]